MLRKHHKFREGHEVRNSDVFLLLFLTPKARPLKYPYISLLIIFPLRSNDSRELGVPVEK